MCAEYEIRTSQKHVEEALRRRLVNTTGITQWEARIKFTDRPPIIEMGPDGPRIVERVFPANPFPNARLSGADGPEQIRRIYDLPTWKQGFAEERCLAIMTRFMEPVYWGDEAGSVMAFRPPETQVFFVAAIGMKPNVPKTGKRDGFALLTHVATPQMLAYHHRYVVVLKPENALEWLEPGSPLEKFDWLNAHRFTGDLSVERERRMAKGWEKRVGTHERALAEETAYTASLAREGVKG